MLDLDSDGIKELVLAWDIYSIYLEANLDEVWGFYHGTSVVHHGLRLSNVWCTCGSLLPVNNNTKIQCLKNKLLQIQ
jgi:hypothetical protein